MTSQIEKVKKYYNTLLKKAGHTRSKDNDDDNFRYSIRNSRNSIIIGDSDYGQIGIDFTKLIDGEIKCLTVGTSGSGKSYITRNIIEQFYEKKTGIIIVVDPEGEYWTLREKYDFVILGVNKDFCDIVIDQDNTEELANNIIKNNINVIIDLLGTDDRNKQEIISKFIDTLIENEEECLPIQLIIEEASRFAKKGDSSAVNIKCTGSLKKTAQFGRKRQLSTFYNTQRITQLHKDIVAECNTKLAGKVDDIADVNRISEIMGIKDGNQFRKLKFEFLSKGYGFDHDESNLAIKFKSNSTNSRHLKSTKRNKTLFPKPNNKVKEWILLMGGKLPNELKAILTSEIVETPTTLEIAKTPKISISEDDKIKDIVKYFGKINISDLYVLLVRDNFNEISAKFEFNLFCKNNSDFKLNEDTIYYLEDETDIINITSELVMKLWKEKIKDYDYCKVLTYLYEMNNDNNRISELEKSLGLRKECIITVCNTFESLNLTRVMNNSIYLNTVLFFDKNTDSDIFEEMKSVDDFNDDDDDFFNNDDE